MLNRSTEHGRWCLAAFLLALLGGCATAPQSVPVGTVAGGPAASSAPAPRNAPAASSAADSSASTTEPAAAGPTTRVNARNAADFAAAIAAMKAERWGDAQTLLRRVTADQPELAGPWINLGQVYVQLEQPEEARLAFRRAIGANPNNCAAYNQLGVLFRTQGEFAEAEAHYLKCVNGTPDFAAAYLNLGILYELYLGRLQEALAAYRQYQVLVPEPDRKVAGWVMDLERRTGE